MGLRRALRSDAAEGGRFCLIWILVPIALVVGASFTGSVSYHVRYVSGVYPALALILACGLLEARRSVTAGLASALFLGGIGISLAQWYTSDNYAKEESRGGSRPCWPGSTGRATWSSLRRRGEGEGEVLWLRPPPRCRVRADQPR